MSLYIVDRSVIEFCLFDDQKLAVKHFRSCFCTHLFMYSLLIFLFLCHWCAIVMSFINKHIWTFECICVSN